MGWPDRTLRGTKKPQAAWRPAAIFVIQSLSQPQVRARRPKVKIRILAAQGVADLLTAPMHEPTVTNSPAPSMESLGNVPEVTYFDSPQRHSESCFK
jgi:hypothetical protein